METFTHVLAFYFLAKWAGLRKRWAGMLAAAVIDVALILFGWVIPKFTDAALSAYWEPVHHFLHSFLVVLILLPLLYFGRHLFIAVTSAVYLHIIMDMVSHRDFPLLFYPLSDVTFPGFLVSGGNPLFVLVAHIILTALLLHFEARSVMAYLKARKGWFRWSGLSAPLWAIIILVFSAGYFRFGLQMEYGSLYAGAVLLGAFNILMTAGLFLRELDRDGIWPRRAGDGV